ncbi:MAG: hypothetical protein ABIQ55_05135 [Gemmatimonadaceae bacterium]
MRGRLQPRLDGGGHRDAVQRSPMLSRHQALPMQRGAEARRVYLSRLVADAVHQERLGADAAGPAHSARWTVANALSALSAWFAAAVKTGQPADAVRRDAAVPALNLRLRDRLALPELPTRVRTVLRMHLPAPQSAKAACVALTVLVPAPACLHLRPTESPLGAPLFHQRQPGPASQRHDGDDGPLRRQLAQELEVVLLLPAPHRADGGSEPRPEQ